MDNILEDINENSKYSSVCSDADQKVRFNYRGSNFVNLNESVVDFTDENFDYGTIRTSFLV